MDSTVIKEQDNQKMEITPEKEKMVIAITTYYGSSAKKDLWNINQNPLQRNLDKTIESALELKRNGLDVEIVIGLDGFKRYDDRKKDLLAKGVLIKEEQEELEEIYKKEAQLKETKRMIDEAFDKMDNLQIAYTAIEANEQMYAGGMRNTIFAEYKNQDTLLTFLDDDDYLIPEKMENLVKTIKRLNNANYLEDLDKLKQIDVYHNLEDAEYEKYLKYMEELKTKKILEFTTCQLGPTISSESNGVWACLYRMKNFDLIPMPAETILEDRIFKLLNFNETAIVDSNDNFFYHHSQENGSVHKESKAREIIYVEPIQYKQKINDKLENENTGYSIISDDSKIKLKDYLITNGITLEQILENIDHEEFCHMQAISNLLPFFLNNIISSENPSHSVLIDMKEKNELNELKLKQRAYQKLETIAIEESRNIESNINNPEADKFFDSIEKRKQLLEKEIEELERTGGGQSLPRLTSDSNINPETNIRYYTVTKNDICEHKKIAINTFDSQFISKEINQPKKIKKSRKKVKQPKKNLEEQSKLSEKLKNMSEDLLEISLTESLQETELVLEDPKNKIKDK